jgi:genome maintenance exonuclease 1|tara:strand:+ start:4125 stop:4775 length:651 start_codon:yes stop_codon:yes gene_type:complete
MFNHVPIEVGKLVQVNSKAGRYYETPSGAKYPSVTSVTKLHSQASILAWKERVGEEEAGRISRRALGRGNKIHSLAEKYLLNEGDCSDDFSKADFGQMIPFLDNINNIRCLETKLYSDHLKVAGTADCIAEYEGKLTVIDFKTSAKMKKREWVKDYFMQCSAYAVMFEERTSIPIERLLLIINVEDEGIQLMDGRRDDYIEDFLDLRETFRKLKEL